MTDKLEAGPELDAKMAELMGWHKRDSAYGTVWVAQTGVYKALVREWKPSTNIADAWVIVETAMSYYGLSTDIDGGTNKACFHHWTLCFSVPGKAKCGEGFGETAPEAICQAALTALEGAE